MLGTSPAIREIETRECQIRGNLTPNLNTLSLLNSDKISTQKWMQNLVYAIQCGFNIFNHS